jgi:hypothetical protein
MIYLVCVVEIILLRTLLKTIFRQHKFPESGESLVTTAALLRVDCASRYSLPDELAKQTNYQTHTPSVHPTLATFTLFEIKLSHRKLVTTSFQHREIICGARKSFLVFSLRWSIAAEPLDLQQVITRARPGKG